MVRFALWVHEPAAPVPGWKPVEAFTSLNIGPLNGQGNWIANGNVNVALDPQDSMNKVMSLRGGDEDTYKSLPDSISPSSMGTIFYRMRRNDVVDSYAGTSDRGSALGESGSEADTTVATSRKKIVASELNLLFTASIRVM